MCISEYVERQIPELTASKYNRRVLCDTRLYRVRLHFTQDFTEFDCTSHKILQSSTALHTRFYRVRLHFIQDFTEFDCTSYKILQSSTALHTRFYRVRLHFRDAVWKQKTAVSASSGPSVVFTRKLYKTLLIKNFHFLNI